jgi:molybdopterin molybdotransferase
MVPASPPMISETEARSKILAAVAPLPARRVALADALNCFAAEDYFARVPLPAFDNSAMDGYAIMARSGAAGQRLRVIGEQPAGVDRRLRVSEGEAVRIFTGASIPAGADAVIMQEDVTRDGDHIAINEKVTAGDFIRRKGCDLAEGQKFLSKGERIRPAVAALLRSQGFADVSVGGQVAAGVISTGDEIVDAGAEIKPGQIYDSNSVMLGGLLRQIGAAVGLAEHCRDERTALSDAVKRGTEHRVLIITGGISVGEHDLVQSVMRDLGGKIDIWRVAVKPGKPFLFGRIGDCAVFGLPGNPVSAFVTFLKFVRPAILKMMGAGASELELRHIPARLSVDLRNDGDRVHYLRGRYEGSDFTPVGRQESHALFGLSRANALLRIEPSAALKAGTLVDVEIWEM